MLSPDCRKPVLQVAPHWGVDILPAICLLIWKKINTFVQVLIGQHSRMWHY